MRRLLEAYQKLSELVGETAMEEATIVIEESKISIEDLERLRVASGDMAMRCKNLIEELKYGGEENGN